MADDPKGYSLLLPSGLAANGTVQADFGQLKIELAGALSIHQEHFSSNDDIQRAIRLALENRLA